MAVNAMSVRYTGEQSLAIGHRVGPSLWMAVAGAGKTTTIEGFVKGLVDSGEACPQDVLVVTFSRRGAEDMTRRAAELCVPAGVDHRTLHSYAYEMLREVRTARRALVPKGWQLCRIVKDTLRDLERSGAPRGSLPKLGDVLREIGLAKAAMVWPNLPGTDAAWTAASGRRFPAYAEWATTREREPLTADLASVMATCYAAVEVAGQAPEAAGFPKEAGSRWVTFDDMIAMVGKAILTGAKWTSRSRGRFKWVVVDEVQDNSEAQWVMVEHLAVNAQLVAVGDDQQSIYAFRGARPALMADFLRRYPTAKVYPMTANFRCAQKIIDAANGVLVKATERLYQGMLVRGRTDACAAGGDVAFAGYGTAEEEARAVVDDIVTQVEGGRSPDSIACLYRLNAMSGPLEMALIRRGVRYRVAGSSFFNRGEVRAIIGYLGVALNNDDETSFEGCYGTPLRGLGREFLKVCPTLTATRNALAKGELGRWRSGARELVAAVDRVKALLDGGNMVDALTFAADDLGVRRHFRDEAADDEAETETDQAIDGLLGAAASIGSAADLVTFAREMTTTGQEDHDGRRDHVARVTLSTVHKAKGLEWDAVMVCAMNEGAFPFARAPLDEERRLAYVAFTRAANVLRVSWSMRTATGQATEASQFVADGEAGIAAASLAVTAAPALAQVS